jgi:hypothetical protein
MGALGAGTYGPCDLQLATAVAHAIPNSRQLWAMRSGRRQGQNVKRVAEVGKSLSRQASTRAGRSR